MNPFTRTPFGNLESMYGTLDYEGKVVLDIGADYGTTAAFFLSRGAARVYVSEREPEWLEALVALSQSNPAVTVLEPLSSENAEDYLREYEPQVVKVDCERCERFFLDVPDPVLSIPEAWVMETHTQELYDRFVVRFRSLGYTVETVEEFPGQKPGRCIKVITAVRP